MSKPMVYLIGSLANRTRIVELANQIEDRTGWEAFADWTAPGPHADSFLHEMAKARGWDYAQTIESHAARHVCAFDELHLRRADAVVLVLPCGKSAHMELGFCLALGKPCYVLMDQGEPERVDVMLNLGKGAKCLYDVGELCEELKSREIPF